MDAQLRVLLCSLQEGAKEDTVTLTGCPIDLLVNALLPVLLFVGQLPCPEIGNLLLGDVGRIKYNNGPMFKASSPVA